MWLGLLPVCSQNDKKKKKNENLTLLDVSSFVQCRQPQAVLESTSLGWSRDIHLKEEIAHTRVSLAPVVGTVGLVLANWKDCLHEKSS